MDVSNNDCKKRCNSKKPRSSDERNCKDLISDLPDDIIVHILSYLPIKDAISTSFLRKRFRNLWRHIRVLDFGQCIYRYFEELDPGLEHYFNFRNFICRLLDLLESDHLDKFYFEFDFFLTLVKDRRRYEHNETDAEWEKGLADHLEKLITYALEKQVKVMEFDLRDGGKVRHRSEIYNMPDVLRSNHLTNLTLCAVNMKLCRTMDLKVLKVMWLDNVTLTDEIMEKVLAGCPLLEDMSLFKCFGLKILVCKNPNLKKVMLTLTYKESESIIISCPHVLSLDISGWVERAYLLRASSAIDISIFFSRFCCTRKQPDVRRLLKECRKCRTFRPCLSTIMVFTIWNFRNRRCPSFKWQNLILQELGMTKWHHPGLSFLLRNSKSLETLTMNLYTESFEAAMLLEEPDAEWIKAQEFDMDKFWESQEAYLPSLETITVNCCLNEPHVIDIVKFLLRSAPSLEKLVICTRNLPNIEIYDPNELDFIEKKQPKKFTSEQLQELAEKLNTHPRASPRAVIYVS